MLQIFSYEESQIYVFNYKYNKKKSKPNIYVCFYFFAMIEIYVMETDEQNKALIRLGMTIRKLREETTSFSQDKLGLEVDLSENQIRRIEKGQTNPTVKSLLKIAKALKVDIRNLFQ